ncbi:hypothetical protein Ciccas_003523, partial [Cichlidogyrus casuarinus]
IVADALEIKKIAGTAYFLLEGDALKVASGFSKETLVDWTKMKEAMKARFGLSSIKAFERLKTIRMEDFDSWDAYSSEVRIQSSAVGKELELAALISGAPADIAPHLRAIQMPTVDTVSSVGRALCSIPVPTPTGLVASPEGPHSAMLE